MAKPKTIQRAVSVHELVNTEHHTLAFDGAWANLIGLPELTGSWLIWGNSGSGKTRFALQLAKYFTRFCRVAYNSLEEGASASLKHAVIDVNMMEVRNRFMVLDKEPLAELTDRLSKHKSPQVIFIDSVQYSGLNYAGYIRLIEQFRNKLFVFVSHADGKNPAGRVARSIRYDAMVKLYVEGYRVPAPASRYGGGEPFTIWAEGAIKCWGHADENDANN
jgi:predicted ATP-dependent serine protease